ncbi:MAG: chromosome segregation protein SMC [Verrucomicrobiota bacterium]|nr:chromosome segregation protein SMC [Verrucomicrobiota bacterium]
MHLKRLEITGFKSFADTTKLHFDSGIIAIVGPNGCGKSNIADAIRWVLGEQSAKAIRGKSMEDVVFSGTDRRRPLGMAEVSLTLADTEELGIEYNEITVTRRVFRTGESQYLINKTPCRLKDIQDLFADTGIGRTAYSIMAQGKIDQILSSRPEERRLVFEEAAGITRYKSRRNEALRKLAATENNLLRLNDVLAEVERRKTSLQRQAGKALRHQELTERKRGLEWTWVLHRNDELAQGEERLTSEATTLEARLELSQQGLRNKEDQLDEFRSNLDQIEEALGDLRQQRGKLDAQRNENENLLRVNQERIDELEELAARHADDISGSTERKAELQQLLEHLREQQAVLQLQVEENKEGLEEQQLGLQQLRDRFNALQNELIHLRDALFNKERTLSITHNQIAEGETRLRGLQERLERLERERSEHEQALAAAQAVRDGAIHTHTSAQAEHRLAEEQVQAAQAAVEQTRENQEAAREELARIREQIGQFESRLHVFEQLEAAFEGFQKGAQAILKHELEGIPGTEVLRGTLATQLVVADGFNRAIEAALGNALQTILIDHPSTARTLFTQLDRQQKGRAILYPTPDSAPDAPLPQPPIAPSVEAAARRFGLRPALELCNPEPALRSLVDALLSHVWVANDLDTALLAHAEGCRATIVTQTGESITACGLIEGGARQDDTESLLARQALIQQLRRDLIEQRQAQDLVTARIEEIRYRLDLAEQDSAAAHAQLAQATRRLATAESEQESRQQELQRIQKQGETLAWEHARITEEITERERPLLQLKEQERLLAAEVHELRLRIATQEAAIQAQREEQEAVMETLSAHKVNAARLQQEFESCCHQIPLTEQRIQELESTTQAREQDLATFQERTETLEQQMEDARESLGMLQIQVDELDTAIEAAQNRRTASQELIRETEAEVRSERRVIETQQQAARDLDVQLARTRTQREDLHQRVLEEYGIAIDQIPTDQLPPLNTPPQWDEIQEEIADLKSRLERMGPVNLLAIEEHEALCERCDFLQDQNNDLVRCRDQLVTVIQRINETSKELFERTFQEVRTHFQGLFAKLFGGGKADLQLSESDDPLEAGIEIIAQPPSKKLQNITLLSGGERTLTAVALLFALYQVKPSPFCLLDELDAPLDESNIDRFAKLVEEFSRQSQFLLITHNRRTIAIADTIYGVTMQETGVSNMVSVRMRTDDQGRAQLDDHPDLLEDAAAPQSPLPDARQLLRHRSNGEDQTADYPTRNPLDELVEQMQAADAKASAVQQAIAAYEAEALKEESATQAPETDADTPADNPQEQPVSSN